MRIANISRFRYFAKVSYSSLAKKLHKMKDKQLVKSLEECSISELKPWPKYIADRIALWDALKAKYLHELELKPKNPIEITLLDGKVVDGVAWQTSPHDIAQKISKSFADSIIIAKVNGELWDLKRPLEQSCQLQLLKFEDREAQQVFWHSSAHVLGEALERLYGGCLCYGPPIESGYYYDMFVDDKGVSRNDYAAIDSLAKKLTGEKQDFERLEISKADLLEMFAYNQFKVRILNEKIKTERTTVYRCGSLIDLCRGPHVIHTGKIKAMKVTKNSCAYWEGKSDMETLQRVYGISFPDAKQLKEWEKFQEEAAKRDHRKIGREQELFFFNEMSPGSCFFEPNGARIYETLVTFIKSEYRKRGFEIVITPNMFNANLWKTSGHWDLYAENMFSFKVENEVFALKPMNCPSHCVIFGNRSRSWRELPMRLADFGALHRNELSGALTGLTRVRRFQQDDAHIFCRPDQIADEIGACLDFLNFVYDKFRFEFKLVLSTRPAKFLGDIETWNAAEQALERALNSFGKPWSLNPEDGAFYGPKIDITITDALKRFHQCATIQLDFQLPVRFDLSYVDESGEKKRPVIVHRAILGSVERMMAILTENYAGKWPFWLSPRQAMVIPIHSEFDAYAEKVRAQLFEAGFEAKSDLDAGDTLNKKIRNAQLAQFNFILVVGEKEQTNGTVNVRQRNNIKEHVEITVGDLIEQFKTLKATFAID